MVISRKIEVYVCEPDKELKKEYVRKILKWREGVRRAANMIVAHMFVQREIAQFTYLDDELLQRFANEKGQVLTSAILKSTMANNEQKCTCQVVDPILRGEVPSDIYNSLNQYISKSFGDTYINAVNGKGYIRSYNINIPIPFSAKAISDIHRNDEDENYYFTLFGIPFCCRFGRDRSNNEDIVRRCLTGEYHLCSSCILIEEKNDDRILSSNGKGKNKMFLLVNVDIPAQQVDLIEGKKMFAFLGLRSPILCTCDIDAANGYKNELNWFVIGNEEEYGYRRKQIKFEERRHEIQEKRKELQKSVLYNKGGRGKKKKCQCIERLNDKEENYIKTKLHTYSRMLVNLAIKHRCEEIVLMIRGELDALSIEDDDKDRHYLLYNWNYYNLRQKIEYKCRMYNIKLSVEEDKI